ncbi:cytochrome P450 [Zopfia rhizophila CBS 207.26]|uniref:Cytochrome P450 n=1 Tax=Zopfia rhizophila CBS 207.26 TaxID=1314779 RepID=A0A6A6E1W6_9PEZI|nr:cytochrome P450 [Zopfia rhizophila CBS 207.26]
MERIILSNKYIDELRALPSSILDGVAAQCERHLAWWTTLDVVKHSSLHTDVCRVQLNQNLGVVVKNMTEEVQHGIQSELIDCSSENGFTYLTAFSIVMKITSHTVNRVLVGLPLCRNKEWLETTMAYTVNAMSISAALRPRNVLMRPFIYLCLDARRKVKQNIAKANELLVPIIERLQKEIQDGRGEATLVSWMIQNSKGKDGRPSEIAHKSLFLSLASIHSSVMAIQHAIYDLCQHPEYVKPLREEIEECLAQNQGWTLVALNSMKKLDSFLKESQRINHPGLFSFNRKVIRPIRLSDNTVLPAGSFISMPTYSLARDPEYYTDPLEFKPFRFYEMREKDPENSNRHQYASTSRSNLAFGYGRAACPGRFLATAEIKLICAQLIHRFDMRFPEGQTMRPDNVYIDERITPDRGQQIGFRLR